MALLALPRRCACLFVWAGVCGRRFCQVPQGRRVRKVFLVLALCLRTITAGLPSPLTGESLAGLQRQTPTLHVTSPRVRPSAECFPLPTKRGCLIGMSVRSSAQQHSEKKTNARGCLYTASSSVLSSHEAVGRRAGCWAKAAVRGSRPLCFWAAGKVSLFLFDSYQRSGPLCGSASRDAGHPKNWQMTSFLAVAGGPQASARTALSFASFSTAAAVWRNKGRDQHAPHLTPLTQQRSTRFPAVQAKNKIYRQVAFFDTLGCFGHGLLFFSPTRCLPRPRRDSILLAAHAGDLSGFAEANLLAPAECVDVADEEEEPQGFLKRAQARVSKGKKDEFETVVFGEVLRDMVRLRFLHEEQDKKLVQPNTPYLIDGRHFEGFSPFASPPWGPMQRMVPYDRSLATNWPSVREERSAPVASADGSEASQRPAKEVTEFWDNLAQHTKNWDFYAEPGSRVQKLADGGVLVTPPIAPNRVFMWTKGDVKRRAFENPYADGTVRYAEPSYLNPAALALRTGRKRDTHRRTDTGKKQKTRWRMDDIQGDIPRGNWTFTNDIYKDMLDSVDWEREWPHLHDKNYYRRSHYGTLTGDNDRNEDSYWDPQFIGGVDTYPRVSPAGMNFTWPVYWVPWLCKKHPRRGGQPLKSEPFNLGGVEPLQLWFYPDGCELAHPGFCSVKLVSRPGWNLPFRIKLWIQGSTVDIPVTNSATPAFFPRGAAATGSPSKGDVRPGRIEEARDRIEGSGGRLEAPAGVYNTLTQPFLSKVEIGPVWREESDYVAYSASFCRLLDKNSFLRLPSFPLPPFKNYHPSLPTCFNPATDVVLRAAGDVDIGVAVAEENWEWDDGHCSVEQWLKLQSAYPDDFELEETLPASFTHSDMFENYKYRDLPDKHYAKYLPSALPPPLEGADFEQVALNRRHAY